MSTARGALTIGSVAATPAGEALSAAEDGGKRWMLHYGRLLDGSCVAVAAAVDRCGAFCGRCGLSCCYADVDVVSVVWVRVRGGCFRVAPVSLPAATSHTHPWCTPSPLRPHEVLATSASAVVTFDGSGQRIRGREEERRRPTPSSSPAEPGIQRSRPPASERCGRPESNSLKSQARAN